MRRKKKKKKKEKEKDPVCFPKTLVNLCRILNYEIRRIVETGKHTCISSEFKVDKGLKQGNAIAPLLNQV